MKDIVLFKKIRLPGYSVKAIIWIAVSQVIVYWSPMLLGVKGRYDLTCFIDGWFPVIPLSVIIYFGAFLLWASGILWITTHSAYDARRYAMSDVMGKTVALICFLAFPCTLVQPEPTGVGAWLLTFLYSTDQPINLLPSLHCFTTHLIVRPLWANWYPQIKRPLRIALFTFAVLIYISTLTTRQHVFADVVAGIALAEACWQISGRICGKRK